MKKRLFKCAWCFAATVFFLGLLNGYVHAAPINLKVVTFFTTGSAEAGFLQQFLDEMNQRAKGELNIKRIGGPEVITSSEQGMAVKRGTVDMCLVPAAYYKGIIKEAAFVEISQITADEERKTGFHQLMLDLHKNAGLYYLGRFDASNIPLFYLSSSKEIKSPQDLVGQKVGSGSRKAWPPALGMTLVIVPYMDTYTAMERGTTTATFKPLKTMISLGLQEVCKYAVDHPFNLDNTVAIINLNTWNSLPQHLKDVIENTYFEMRLKIMKPFKGADDKAREKLISSGLKFVKFPPDVAKKYLDTIYEEQYNDTLQLCPEYGPQIIKMIRK